MARQGLTVGCTTLDRQSAPLTRLLGPRKEEAQLLALPTQAWVGAAV